MNVGASLVELLAPWIVIKDKKLSDLPVSVLKMDSRMVVDGDTFVAVNGHAADGRQFIPAAIEKGANLVLAQSDTEAEHGNVTYLSETPVISFYQLDQVLSELALRLYPLDHLNIIGVTGTNGKTTISQLIAQWLELLGHKTSVMGTTGNGFLQHLSSARNTTGSPIEIVSTLASHQQSGAEYASIEVSSHGLVQGRVKAIPFKVGIFTNLSRDHLDYHGDMNSYALAKKSLFTAHHCEHAIINVDDKEGAAWMTSLPNAISVSLSEPVGENKKSLWATKTQYTEHGIEIHYDGRWGTGVLRTPLIGEFNASNLFLSFASLLALGMDSESLLATAPELTPVIGRMELFSRPDKPKVVVDYAHTPDALEKALNALRIHCEGKLWAVFGCGGDRDTGKRPLMAEVAERLADRVILTDDNPRTEPAQNIIQDMLAGLKNPHQVTVIHSRFDALQSALNQADDKDIILLAGKGHEDYQIIGRETIHYSDRESAETLLEAI
ncbi:UDP-N-acetylmuramoyl-L-alanyl-D-glutamate--2,6-diaminopimelate ligase [Vibrio salinus]|uniref:UDP-N-acetylmuramoyl-L-alanyl-D-glutamate--2, 6-diaminopimelate ligase n=1 Tax=Vibrio salinus TaxID=2899784 RepID=UPI001E4E31FC|nr:UDP-N-acetylmuramoyl-L-alanyl-D-glutamate--2,6-diaminopimelate ligase [Vibrio salinus]MCE0494249.1 UDP-N-acetylmuramoyl-L-alanyl-D-glutamate--2,6-diaminopimelate ligase [Vibrio salinus]